MTDLTKEPGGQDQNPRPDAWAPPPGGGQTPVPHGHQMPAPHGYAPPAGHFVGKQRSTGTCVLLFIITFGIYGIVWYYMVHDEMKRHSGQGLGGGLAVVLAILVSFVSPFFASSEVGMLYERRGQEKPVSGITGCWYIPGFIILVGPIIWFVKTNRALNEYWGSLGAQ